MTEFVLSAFADEACAQLEGQIAALKRNGIGYMEIRNVNGKNILDLTTEEMQAVKRRLDEEHIRVSSIGSPIGKVDIGDFEAHTRRLLRAIEAATIFETDKIRMFSFFVTENHAAVRDEVMEKLRILCELSKKEGIYCYHENEKGIFGDTKARCMDLLTTLQDCMKGIFDPANYIHCGERPGEIFDELMPYTDYIHIKDACYDGSVVPAGYGDGCLKEILQKYKAKGGRRFLTVEPHLTVFEGLSSLQDEELKHKYSYSSNDEAFDAAVDSLKTILEEI